MEWSAFYDNIVAFLAHLKHVRHASHYTLKAYKADLHQFVEFWKEQPTKSNLKKTIKLYCNQLTRCKTGKSTIARKISCFNSYEKFLALQGFSLNLNLARPHIAPPKPKPLCKKDVIFLLDKVEEDELPTASPYRDKSILELLYATGVRCSELINITLSNLNLEERAVLIHSPRKQHRTVYFGTQAYKKLQAYLTHERIPSQTNKEFLFLNYRNQPLTTRSIQRICNMFGDFLPTKTKITPQLLRHSFAAHLIEEGADLDTVQKLLGHSSYASIEKYLT